MALEFRAWLEAVDGLSDQEVLARRPPPCFLASPHPVSLDPGAQTADGECTFTRGLPDELTAGNVDSLLDCRVYPIEKRSGANPDPMTTLGRGHNNDVVVDANSISKLHAVLFDRSRRWFVRDAGSRNGTYVECERLEPEVSTPLADWSVLRFGRVLGRFALPQTLLRARSLLRRARQG